MIKRKISPASLIARIQTLRSRHREISARIDEEHMRPLPDAQKLRQLKRERLGLKDAIRGNRAILMRPGVQSRSIT